MPTLSASAYVVLGLLEQSGSATPYALDRVIQQSIGHFWAFPRSQIYAEAARLVRHGLVVEERETTGRHRRTLSLTPAGREVFAMWLTGPAEGITEIRDEGLLRLFFHQDGVSDEAQVHRLAVQQLQAHRRRLAEYEELLASAPVPGGSSQGILALALRIEPPQAATLALGLRFEQLAVAFWDEIAQGGADAVYPTVPT
jgi:PadR family transcriptional regulator, regulatory protein AphA